MKPGYPFVSIILPTYNSDDYISESIQSILDQTFENFELIVIDDASIDNTVETIKKFSDPRIQLIVKEENTGYTESLNYGLKIAKGDYIARLDSDDISMPTRLEKQVAFLESHKDYLVCGSWHKLIPHNKVVRRPSEHEDIKVSMLVGNPLCHSSVMFRRDVLLKNNIFYNKEFEPAEDYELWIRLLGLGKIYNLPEVLVHYRLHDNQVSAIREEEQLEKIKLCRVEIIKFLLDKPTKLELYILENFLFRSTLKLRNINRLVGFLNKLLLLNEQKLFFKKDEFRSFIEVEKRKAVREHFIFRKKFNLKLLTHFYISPCNKKYLTILERKKFVIKCLFFQKTK